MPITYNGGKPRSLALAKFKLRSSAKERIEPKSDL